MLIHQLLLDRLREDGKDFRLLADRELASYSWAELMEIHPDARQIAAELIDADLCVSMAAFEARYTPMLTALPDESDYEFDQRLAAYIEHQCFPAQSGSLLNAGTQGAQAWVCTNPLLPFLDAHSAGKFVLVPPQVVDAVLRGTRSQSAIAPYSDDEPIDAWVNRLIAAAHAQGAADIEITSHPSSMKVRLHILGEWTDWVSNIPLTQRGPLLRTLCASASPSLDYEAGTDHDFKIEKRIQGIDTSWRGAITPAALGDSVTLRALPQMGRVPTLSELGFCEQAQSLLRRVRQRRDGLLIVTGPTGEGKSTTLYSLITEMRDANKKVFSVEHPVELVIPGTVQKPVMDGDSMDDKFRTTFAGGIRAALRHKPDVLVVGETRDVETAQAAVGASRTGHLTFTTLHTTNVRISVKRLLDLGIDATNLADTLSLVVSQHLIRTLCLHCRIEHADGTSSRNPQGCSHCHGRGVAGKTVIYELACLDDEAREAIIDGALHTHFPRLREAGLYISKADSARRLVTSGRVDPKEVEAFGV